MTRRPCPDRRHVMSRVALRLLAIPLAACAPRAGKSPRMVTSPPAAPVVVQGALRAEPLLGELPAKAREAGAGPLAIVSSTPLTEGERTGAFVLVPKDMCLLTYARGSSSLADLDLAVFTDDGNPVAVDEGPDPKPAALVCPPHAPRLYVAVHAASGQGLATIGAQLVPRERALSVGQVASAKGALGGTPKSSDAWPGLDELVVAHRASLGGAWEEVRRVAVDADARVATSVAFPIAEGGCTDALLIADSDVALVDAEVVDAKGQIVGRSTEGVGGRTLTVCSPFALDATLQVRPHVGRGLVAVVLSKLPADQTHALAAKPFVAWTAPVVSLEAARTDAEARLSEAHYGPPTHTQTGQLVLGRRSVSTLDLGHTPACKRVDVVAGAPLALVDGAVWSEAGALLARGEGVSGATFFVCAKGKVRLDLGTRGRPGPYALTVRPEPWQSPLALAHPLAASRMFEAAAKGPDALFDGTGETLRHAPLSSESNYVYTAPIRPNTCLIVALGVAGEGVGLDARIVDASDDDELDRTYGEHAGRLQACANEATRTVRVEAHMASGHSDALIGERVTSLTPTAPGSRRPER